MRALKILILALPALLAAGCSSSSNAPSAEPSSGNRFKNMLFLGSANPAPAAANTAPQIAYDCPSVDILPGTAAYVVGDQNDPFNVRYQASMGQLARECTLQGDTHIAMRVGVSGRLMVGPKGQTGTSHAVPVRIAVLNPEGKPVASKLVRVNVALPAGTAGADFVHVEDMGAIPLDGNKMRHWKVVVGFDGGTRAR